MSTRRAGSCSEVRYVVVVGPIDAMREDKPDCVGWAMLSEGDPEGLTGRQKSLVSVGIVARADDGAKKTSHVGGASLAGAGEMLCRESCINDA